MSNKKFTVLDGGMGTMLQAAGLAPGEHPEVFGYQNPDVVKHVHEQYIDAGSRVIYANTFGGNPRKLMGCEIDTKTAVASAIKTAKAAAAEGEAKYHEQISVALDVGPIGELLEPLGTVTFEEAYDAYKETMIAGEEAGADLVVIETFTDLQDARAAVLAALENTSLPIWVTMTFEDSGRTFTGTTLASFALTMEGLGVSAVGINCSLGPVEILPLAKELSEWTNLPIVIKPNAGLPDPETGEYLLKAPEFSCQMMEYRKLPLIAMGGCCGTNPSYIKALNEEMQKQGMCRVSLSSEGEYRYDGTGLFTEARTGVRRGICSATNVVEYGGVRVIGERLNPTGKKKFQQALLDRDMDYICKIALAEEEAGADVLDVNVGVPGADEKRLMVEVVKALQGVISVPLQIDSAEADVVEAALRVYSGRAIVNSVNADDERLDAFLPVLKKYGAATVGLCLDEDGIPQTAEGRFEKAAYILKRVTEYGIPKEDILIDCLTLTVSAQQNQAIETLKALRRVHEELGLHACLGVSNISFGLPARSHITENFLIQAMHCGLDFPIINPNTLSLMDAVASYKVLSMEDVNCDAYIKRFSNRTEQTVVTTQGAQGADNGKSNASKEMTVQDAVLKGLKNETRNLAKKLLETMSEETVINDYLIPALDHVGDLYEKQVIFLPQLISSANAATAAFDMIKERILTNGADGAVSNGTIVICTVKGDIHDIGKNIVKVILENYGYKMIDLGRDVPVEKVVEATLEHDAKMVGLSALMTTTLPAMEETIEALHAAAPDVKIMVGGAVLTPEYAEKMGADYYCVDARASVAAAKEVFGK
ncbi:MAG: homocysteine methyltransferase [Lachnospiraceae bacterium]|nr:homocysteine methyltransferase [Lachnospiraceae bacterium]